MRGRPGGVERLEMGANGRGGAGGFIGGLGRGVDGLNVAIEERFQWHVMAMKARATSARGEG